MKSATITRLEEYIADNCKTIDREERFNEMLDECYSFDKVGGPFAYMVPSTVLKEMDPVAYRCGVNDCEDSVNWVEVGGEYYEQDAAEKAKAEFIEELESDISALESEIEEQESEEDPDEVNLAAHKRTLAEKQAELAEANAYTF